MKLAARIQRVAALALAGRPAILPPPAPEPCRAACEPAAVAEARERLDGFAARLLELIEARDAFDAAVAAARESGFLDLAGLLAARPGEPLPDLGDLDRDVERCRTRLKALRTLADRELAVAANAVRVLRQASAANVKAARAIAEGAARDAITACGLFEPAAAIEAAGGSRPVRECVNAARAVEASAAWRLPMRAAELFGYGLARFRVEELPTARSGAVPVADAFDPRSAARDLRRLLTLHGRSCGFIVAMAADPAGARWEGPA